MQTIAFWHSGDYELGYWYAFRVVEDGTDLREWLNDELACYPPPPPATWALFPFTTDGGSDSSWLDDDALEIIEVTDTGTMTPRPPA